MIDGRRANEDDLREFAPILVGNALPIVGIVWFDLLHTLVFVLYLFEILTLVVVYCGCALFAQQEMQTEDRDVTPVVVGSDDGYLSSLPTVPLPGPLPPVYLRSLRVIVPSLLVAGFLFVAIGDTLVGGHEAHDTFPAWLSAFREPAVFGTALTIVGSHLIYVYRNYFRPRRYTDLSPVTVLEYPVRLLLVLVPGVIGLFLTFVIVGLFTLAVASQSAADRIGLATLIGGFFLLLTVLEWAQHRAERAADPDGFAAWLVPPALRSKWGERGAQE
ncbi:DUF6498-containing protein [Natrialba sp. SSL1]|uniref:DUF6498-containing protein n=1 Tax=Natrialba sp. SSL1 TaxID=1869245 RepID=UPI0008F95947|nr:DUF6498-containing protein [Natrialba sp. SSL1]OIB55367.1 hypothetical protein BBD46_03415 [Natrialba sp. SSL1]